METTDRESAIIGATLGIPLRKFRPVTEVWNDKGRQFIKYHFHSGITDPLLGVLSIGSVTSVCTGKKLLTRNQPSIHAREVILLLRDFLRNSEKLKNRWLWAKDRDVALVCLTLGMKYEALHSSILNHVSFVDSFPLPVKSELLGFVHGFQVDQMFRREAPNPVLPSLTATVIRWLFEASENRQVYQEWQKTKVVPMVIIGGRRFDTTVAMNASDSFIDSMRKKERQL